MRNLLQLISILLCMGLMNPQTVAQIHVNIIECNTIIVSNDASLKTSKKVTDFSFILEKHIGNDIWMSLKKKNKDIAGTAFLNLKPGVYRVKLSSSNGQKSDNQALLLISEMLEIKYCKESTFLNGELIVDIFPNPASNVITAKIMNVAEGVNNLSLFNTQGKKLKEFKSESNLFTLPIDDLSKGVYFIDIIDSEGKIAHKKVIVY